MRMFLDVFNTIAIFILTIVLLTTIWYSPGPNSVLKSEVVKHGAAHWEVCPDGNSTFIWNK
jgi:hypothetical protein